ncbi:MAG: LysR substrate-binding domain-containing protein [Acetobacteraceae bacterium]
MRRYLDQQLKLRQLRAITAIGSQGSLLKASHTLGVSQPALTKALHEAEDLIGSRLFERHARGVRATPVGELVIEAAARILAELGRLEAELDRIGSGAGGTVSLGALPVAAGGVLPGALARLKRQHPDLIVRMVQGVTEDLLAGLAAGDLDLIVGRLYEPVTPDGLVRERLYEEPFAIVARADHPIFAGAPTLERMRRLETPERMRRLETPERMRRLDASERVRRPDILERLRRYDLVLPTIGQRIGQELEHLLVALDLPPAAALRSTSAAFIREMLHSTDLISVMPGLLMAGDLMRGTLRIVPVEPALLGPPRPAGLIMDRSRGLSPAAAALVACLRSYLVEMGAKGLADITGRDSSDATRDRTAPLAASRA